MVLLISAFISTSLSADESETNLHDAEIIKGKSIYNNTCLFCHGAKAGGARAPGLTTGPYSPGGGNDDSYIFETIKNGRPGTIMGAFSETLTDEEIMSVIKYIRYEAMQLSNK